MSDTTVTITSETLEYMADRIEELEAKLRWVLDERDATFALMLKRAETAEAKLAKAVELALEECPFQEGTINYDYWWNDYRSTLAELAGGKDAE